MLYNTYKSLILRITPMTVNCKQCCGDEYVLQSCRMGFNLEGTTNKQSKPHNIA
jgi:hypothetical protein